MNQYRLQVLQNFTSIFLFPPLPHQNIFHWSGSNCNRFERLKTTELAIDIRDNELRGRGKVEMIDEGSEPEEVIKVSFYFDFFLNRKPNICGCNCDFNFMAARENASATMQYVCVCFRSLDLSLTSNPQLLRTNTLM